MLSTNTESSYQYNFPKRSGDVAIGAKVNGETYLASKTDGLINFENNLNPLIEVTYSELVSLRDNSQLIPGRLYRIVDYSTIITHLSYTTAGHDFDLILEALSTNELSHDARAIRREYEDAQSFGVAIDYLGDYYFVFDGWKSWEYNNLPEGLKEIVNETASIKRQLFKKTLKAGELKIKVTTRCHRSISKQTSNTYSIPLVGIDLCNPSINEDDQTTWKDHVVSYDYHRYVSSISGSVEDSNNRPEHNSTYEYVLNVPTDGTYVICIVIDDTSDILTNSNNPLRSELGVYGEVFEILDNNYFDDSSLELWKIKYSLDNDITKFNWAGYNSKGVIYYMKDEKDNECPYDFKNILFNELYTFSYIIGGKVYDGSVKYNYCYGNKILPAHNSENIRKLNNIVFKNTTISSYCVLNSFGFDCEGNIFEDSCLSNTFGNYCRNNIFGTNCQYNLFADYCSNNVFGSYVQSNNFGQYSTYNKFGDYILRNTIGKKCNNCKITVGNSADSAYASYVKMITFGDECTNLQVCLPNDDSGSAYFQNYYLGNSLTGSIDIAGTPTRGRHYTTFVGYNSNNTKTIVQNCQVDHYIKPSNGIPKTDLDNTVQDILNNVVTKQTLDNAIATAITNVLNNPI